MKNNVEISRQVIKWLRQIGCQEVVVCAGARNAPLVVALNAGSFQVWSYFEERSAAFFALGRMKSVCRPVAVVTTSGTAAAELLPAVIEADYTSLPLVVVTADRPRGYRGHGAPQAIEQVGLYSHYVEQSWDYAGEDLEIKWSGQRPVHLNVCLNEPTRADLEELGREASEMNLAQSLSPPAAGAAFGSRVRDAVEKFEAQCQRPVVVAGPMSREEAVVAETWLRRARLPVYAEALSNLRAAPSLSEQVILGGERSVILALKEGWADGVIRLGGVPTTRLWRELEAELQHVPVMSLGCSRFSGLARPVATALELSELSSWSRVAADTMAFANSTRWRSVQVTALNRLEHLLQEFPLSEPALVRGLSGAIPKEARLFIGNSLPVREADRALRINAGWTLAGSRGANGIDGQLSTFFGFAQADASNWAVVGDLTALYDLSAPWILAQRPLPDMKIVVINNGGGRIFSRMFDQEILENLHQLRFQDWARMWGLSYEAVAEVNDFQQLQPGACVVEVRPDNGQTRNFNQAWDEFWKSI